MLAQIDALATIAVKNLLAAVDFYEKKIGLKKVDQIENQVLIYASGGSKIIVYQSPFAGTNKTTAATWAVDDVDGEVRDLKRKGVAFEHYEFPGITLEGDVHVMGGRRSAWFKDPDGNILGVVSK